MLLFHTKEKPSNASALFFLFFYFFFLHSIGLRYVKKGYDCIFSCKTILQAVYQSDPMDKEKQQNKGSNLDIVTLSGEKFNIFFYI